MDEKQRETGHCQTPAAGTVDVTFATPFTGAPVVEATIFNATPDDELVLSLVTQAGFQVGVKRFGDWIARTVEWEAEGS